MRDRARAFAPRLSLIVAGALAVRLVYALAVDDSRVTGDGHEFHALANLLADKHRYIEPFVHAVIPTAEKPPLYPLVLAVPSSLGLTSYTAHRVVSCLLGAAAVAVIGLIGRRVAGERAGLAAAGIASVYPLLWVIDGTLRSESLYVLLVALSLLAAYRLVDRPSAARAGALGAFVGLAALTRAEALVLIVLLVLPAVWLAQRARRLRLAAVACLACALVVGPWLARNWITFNRPTAISTNEGGLLAGANNHRTYYGAAIGTWVLQPTPRSWGTNEALISARHRRRAFDYAADHASRVPVVATVRVLRTWDLYRPRQQARLDSFFDDRKLGVQEAGFAMYYVLAALAAYGLVVLRRRRAPLRILLAPVALVTLVAFTTYGMTRFRAAAEVPIVVGAAVALVQLYERRFGYIGGGERGEAEAVAPVAR